MYSVFMSRKVARAAATMPKLQQEKLALLVDDIRQNGPVRVNWLNYGALVGTNTHHCHLSHKWVALKSRCRSGSRARTFQRQFLRSLMRYSRTMSVLTMMRNSLLLRRLTGIKGLRLGCRLRRPSKSCVSTQVLRRNNLLTKSALQSRTTIRLSEAQGQSR